MITRILLICIVALSLTIGCGADYGRVKVDNKGFEIEAGTDGDRDNGHKHKRKHKKKCPPGHHMKGEC